MIQFSKIRKQEGKRKRKRKGKLSVNYTVCQRGRDVRTCLDPDGDDVRHVVVLRGAKGAERVGGRVAGAHLQPGGAVRPDAELHQALPLLQDPA